ncbi:MAG: hypothetical protein V1769_01300 [Thermoplasmatota archaeon]
MFRERHFSVQNDFHTGFFSRLFFIFAFILVVLILFIAIIGMSFAIETNGIIGVIVGLYHSSIIDVLLAFLIITVGLGGILYFFNRQFAKLNEIAKELDDEEESNDEEVDQK